MAAKAWFKRRGGTIDLRTLDPDELTCPHCDGPATVGYVDLVQHRSLHTCRQCGRLWESPVPAEHARH